MIQRYCISYGELAKADFDGGLVMYEDYIKLESQNKALRELVEEIVKSYDYAQATEENKYVAGFIKGYFGDIIEKLKEVDNA